MNPRCACYRVFLVWCRLPLGRHLVSLEYRWDNFVTCSSGCGCDNTVTRIFGGAAVGYATVRLFFTFLHILRSKFMSLLCHSRGDSSVALSNCWKFSESKSNS